MRFRLVESLINLCELEGDSFVYDECYLTDSVYDMKNFFINKVQTYSPPIMRIAYDREKDCYIFAPGYEGTHLELLPQAVLNGLYIEQGLYPTDVDFDDVQGGSKIRDYYANHNIEFSMFYCDIEEGLEEMQYDQGYSIYYIFPFGVYGSNLEMPDSLLKILGHHECVTQ